MRILLLGGTAQARRLAPLLRDRGHTVTASLAGVTDAPEDYGVETRRGGFGGADGLARWLVAHHIQAVIDATHPFAAHMPMNTAKAADACGVMRLRFLRPAWPIKPHWRNHATLTEAAAAIPAGARVFAATGRMHLQCWLDRSDLAILLRSIEDPGPLPEHITPLRARPPFTLQDEATLIAAHGITHLVARNSGGARAKLDAADAVGVAIHLVARPAPPPGSVVATFQAVFDWVEKITTSGEE